TPVKAPLDTSNDVSSAVIRGLQEDDFVSIVYNGFGVSLLGIGWVRKNDGVEWAIRKGTKLTGGEGWQVGERRLRDGVLRHVQGVRAWAGKRTVCGTDLLRLICIQ
ncbi:hypothetical protein LTS00_017992, partial [Friedmanniomyces endolithicus]